MSPEEFEALLHHSYLIASDVYTKGMFFFQQEIKVSSTLILMDMLKNWGHPATLSKFKDLKKGRPANNLLLLEVDPSWTSQDVLKGDDGKKYKAFADWGAHAVHVSDLICFRQSYKDKYNFSRFEDLCYDIDTDLKELEYQWQVIK